MNATNVITVIRPYLAVLLLHGFLAVPSPLLSQPGGLEIHYYGMKVKVTDMKAATEMYSDRFGFRITGRYAEDRFLILETGSIPLILEQATQSRVDESGAKIAFQVHKLLPAIDRLRNSGIRILEESLSRNGVGIHINFTDPSGNAHSLMEIQTTPVEPFPGIRIYNTGFTINNMGVAEDFYTGILGFPVLSRNYLPNALPLVHSDGTFAFMLHFREEMPAYAETGYPEEAQALMLFSVTDIDRAVRLLQEKGVEFIYSQPRNGPLGKYQAFKDPFGNVSELIELDQE